MRMNPKWRLTVLSALGVLVIGTGIAFYLKVSHDVGQALAASGKHSEPLEFIALPLPPDSIEHWGGGEVAAVAVTSSSLVTAGAFGVADETGDISSGLPTLQASALALWRGRPVVGLAAGGLFLRRDGRWQEARTGFGTLHVRVLLEGPGGEMMIGAREGLFRAAWGDRALERLDPAPVRSMAIGEGGVLLVGGEEGLRRVEASRSLVVATPDPWVDWVGIAGKDVWALTPLGLLRGPLGGDLTPVSGGQNVRSAVIAGKQTLAVAEHSLLRFEASGRPAEELLPVVPTRIFSVAGQVFVDTAAGLYRRTSEGWTLARPRPPSLPPGSSHVGALASLNSKVVVGLFDGGLVVGDAPSGKEAAVMKWSPVPGTSVWGVNALLPAGGALYVASLRGAARFDGKRIDPLDANGAGAAFSLASTRDGVAIGYGQGVLLPGSRFLSAFHGLPGNQALALAANETLFVGTPSGLGAVQGSRVAWRTTGGDGKLPNPWVTALSFFGDALYVGTYGGGVTRRPAPPSAERPMAGTFEGFVETEGLKVNAGCLVEAGGRLYMGTDGRGLYRLSQDKKRFVPLKISLPSPRITAILPLQDALLIGTDEGLVRLPLSRTPEDF